MGFKRFVAATTKDAMTQVRRALGDDAVILSNKRVASGNIEILAAASSAVEAIVEDARKPVRAGTQAVQIAPGVRRVGPAVESFQDYLRRQPAAPTARKGAPGTVGGASMYDAVATARAGDDDDFSWDSGGDDSGWANSRFDPSLMGGTRSPAPVDTRGSTTARSSRGGLAAPALDTWLPNEARRTAAPAASSTRRIEPARSGSAPTAQPPAEPAIFRRRPSRESVPLPAFTDVPAQPAPLQGGAAVSAARPPLATAATPTTASPQASPISATPIQAPPTAPWHAMTEVPRPAAQPATMAPPSSLPLPLTAGTGGALSPAATAPAPTRSPTLAAVQAAPRTPSASRAEPAPSAMPAGAAAITHDERLASAPINARIDTPLSGPLNAPHNAPHNAPFVTAHDAPHHARVDGPASAPAYAPIHVLDPALDHALDTALRSASGPMLDGASAIAQPMAAAIAPAIVPAITPAVAPAPVAAAAQPAVHHVAEPFAPQLPAAGGPARPASPRTEIRLPAPAPESANAALMAELASLRASLQQQLSSLSNTVVATDAMRRNPIQTRVMTRFLTAGFSVDVARKVALNAPDLGDADAADGWMQDVLAHNLRCGGAEDSIVERGGVYALVGPTGVGKTTTVAKLAARFAVKHGSAALGLITLDAYRVAAHEQLRTYGRILGAPVHLAQDGATLRELLASMKGKRLVLIDTCGLGPRDERLGEMLGVLAQAGHGLQRVQPVLLLNAASHAETLDEAARAWRAGEAVGAILTKLDEAARIGGALDCALRHKLRLLGLTNGQRVPEDLHQPNARLLAHLALKPSSQLFALADDEGVALAHQSAVAGLAAHA